MGRHCVGLRAPCTLLCPQTWIKCAINKSGNRIHYLYLIIVKDPAPWSFGCYLSRIINPRNMNVCKQPASTRTRELLTSVMLKARVVSSVSASTVGVLVFVRWISTLEILPKVVCKFYSKHQKMLI